MPKFLVFYWCSYEALLGFFSLKESKGKPTRCVSYPTHQTWNHWRLHIPCKLGAVESCWLTLGFFFYDVENMNYRIGLVGWGLCFLGARAA